MQQNVHDADLEPPRDGRRRAPAATADRSAADAVHLARIIGESPQIRDARARLKMHAPLGTSVLILGETGTGKGLAATVLHALSRRKGRFVHVNCATISPELADSRLFGHERGAFTSARDRRIGAVERADRGTLFLDEITELPVGLQAKLLTVLDDGCYERVGGSESRRSRFRLVAATSADVERVLGEGQLRSDLYYRIQTGIIRLPSLAARGYDVVLLARKLVERLVGEIGCVPGQLTRGAEALLLGRAWPGNIRQLRALMTTALIRAEDGLIDEALMSDIIESKHASSPDTPRWLPTLEEAVETAKREAIARALAATGGNKTAAAELLGVSPRTLYRCRQELGLE